MKPQSQVSKCANPACSNLFLRLSEGKLFIFGIGAKRQTFWLCQLCSRTLRLEKTNSSIEIVPFAHSAHSAA